MISSMDQVQEYFNCHLERRIWQTMPRDLQLAAVTAAEQDIACALNVSAPDVSNMLIFCAVCEQALFLGNRASTSWQNTPGQLKREAVDGIGSREYYESSDSANRTWLLAPRAELFLANRPEKRSNAVSRG